MAENETPQSAIVRRRSDNAPTPAPFTAHVDEPLVHVGAKITVTDEIVWPLITHDGRLKGPPRLIIRWRLHSGRGRVVAYRRIGGFGTDENPGEKIVDERGPNGIKEEDVGPGNYFYSFFTVRGLFGLADVASKEVQFSRTLPNAEDTIRIMDQAIRFIQKSKEFEDLTKVPPPPEPPAPPVDSEARDRERLERAIRSATSQFNTGLQFSKWCQETEEKIRNGPGSETEKRDRLRDLKGVKKNIRETFEL